MKFRTALFVAQFFVIGGCTGVKLPPVYVCGGVVQTTPCTAPSPSPSTPPTPPSPSTPPTPSPSTPPSTPPTPAPKVCNLPQGTGDGFACPRENATFGDAIATAIEGTVAAREGVDGDVITDPDRYTNAVVSRLREKGYCAFYDGEEIAIKSNNEYSEQWDIIRTPAGGGYFVMRAYMGTCRPAWKSIPSGNPGGSTPPPPPPPPPTCVPHPTTVNCEAGCRANLDLLVRTFNLFPAPGRPNTWMFHEGERGMTPCRERNCSDFVPTPADLAKASKIVDSKCNVRFPDGTMLHPVESGYFGNLCVTTPGVECPPTGPPPPPPPGGECQPLTCFGSKLHSIIDPRTGTAVSEPCRGCRHVLDSTPYFGRCGPRYACNGEGEVWGQTCKDCEDPRGPVWRQIAGPPAECEGGNRGYLCRLLLNQPGTYSFGVCAGGDFRSVSGVLNSNQAACERDVVTFVVP